MSAGSDDAPADIALPRPPGAVQRWLDRHPRVVDWTIATLCQGPLLLIAVILPATDLYGLDTAAWVLAQAALGFVAIVLRRRFPLTGSLALSALWMASYFVPFSTGPGGWADSFVLLYSLGVHSTIARMWIGYAAAASTALVNGILMQLSGSPFGSAILGIPGAVFFLVPTLLGLYIGNRRRYVQAIIDRAKDLARERDQRARLAATEERSRVAREMHDIVSHGLTVMITLSEGAAAQAEAGSSRAPDAMRRVADTGRESLAEMRRLLGLLRDPDAPADLAPQPGSTDLEELVARFREAGLPVRWTHSGAPLASTRSGIPLAAYRIVQEGLTNVLRHAPQATRVAVTLDNRQDDVRIVVENSAAHGRSASDAHAGVTGSPMRGAGRGLIGVRERAAILGGSVSAGPTTGGGWRLEATLRKDEA